MAVDTSAMPTRLVVMRLYEKHVRMLGSPVGAVRRLVFGMVSREIFWSSSGNTMNSSVQSSVAAEKICSLSGHCHSTANDIFFSVEVSLFSSKLSLTQ